MKKLTFSKVIAAPKQKVWETMTGPDTYREWVNESWPGSYYEGDWEEGGKLRFLSAGRGGTLALLEENRPFDYCLARHIAVIKADGTTDTDSEGAKKWIGTRESYRFTEKNGATELVAEIETDPEWEKMFTNDFPPALEKLREICEK